MKRHRLAYGTAAMMVVALGLASRHYATGLPWWVGADVGDGHWALMLYLLLGVIARGLKPWRLAVLTLAVSYGVELSQLYHAPWIDAVRYTRLGGLALGYGFLWSDLACYTAGIATGCGAELFIWRWIEPATKLTPSQGRSHS